MNMGTGTTIPIVTNFQSIKSSLKSSPRTMNLFGSFKWLKPIRGMFFQPDSTGHKKDDDGQPEVQLDTPASLTPKVLHRQMTSLGRFTLMSQTEENPSIITFFVALVHAAGKDLDVKDFQCAFSKRVMECHERFSCQVSRDDDRFFEVCLEHYGIYTSTYTGENEYIVLVLC